MAIDVEQFSTAPPGAGGGPFAGRDFTDASGLRNYLLGGGGQEGGAMRGHGRFAFLIRSIEDFLAVRYRAQERCGRRPSLVRSARRDLPARWENFAEEWLQGRGGEPPERIITRIAHSEHVYIDRILAGMRKILMRTREKIPIPRIQELDAHCLRNFIRLPGCSVEEKAGSRQRLLAVRRVESHDTLENRVLKDFLRRCVLEGGRYLRWHRQGHENSVRIREVEHWVGVCKNELRREVFSRVAALSGLPSPNYVLMQDSLYSRLWRLYLELVGQARMVERLWKSRHGLFEESVRVWIRIAMKPGPWPGPGGPVIKRVYRTTPVLSNAVRGGRFLAESLPFGLYRIGGRVVELVYRAGEIRFRMHGEGDDAAPRERALKTAFIPYSVGGEVSVPSGGGVRWLIRNESGCTIAGEPGGFREIREFDGFGDAVRLAVRGILEELWTARS